MKAALLTYNTSEFYKSRDALVVEANAVYNYLIDKKQDSVREILQAQLSSLERIRVGIKQVVARSLGLSGDE